MAMTQAEAIATLEEGHSQLVELMERLDEAQATRPATIGGGEWSASDLLAHIACWEEIALRTAAEWRSGQEPWVETVFREKRVDEVNAENHARSRQLTLAAVRQRANTAHAQLVELVRGMPESDWRLKAPHRTERRENLGFMLGAITGAPKRGFGHVFAHLPDLEAYVAEMARRPTS
jgi:hypothetical protein